MGGTESRGGGCCGMYASEEAYVANSTFIDRGGENSTFLIEQPVSRNMALDERRRSSRRATTQVRNRENLLHSGVGNFESKSSGVGRDNITMNNALINDSATAFAAASGLIISNEDDQGLQFEFTRKYHNHDDALSKVEEEEGQMESSPSPRPSGPLVSPDAPTTKHAFHMSKIGSFSLRLHGSRTSF